MTTAPRYPVLLAAVEIVEGVNDTIRYSDGGEYEATVAPGTYFLRGDGEEDDLLAAIVDALNESDTSSGFGGDCVGTLASSIDASAQAATVTLSALGPSGYALLGTGTFDLSLLGLEATPDLAGEEGPDWSSARSPSCVWVSNEPYTSMEPDPSIEGEQHRTPAGQVYTFLSSSQRNDRDLVMELLAAERALRERNTSDPAASLEAWWELARDGRPLEYHLQSIGSGTTLSALSSSSLIGRYVLGIESIRRVPVELRELAQMLYTARLRLLGYVP